MTLSKIVLTSTSPDSEYAGAGKINLAIDEVNRLTDIAKQSALNVKKDYSATGDGTTNDYTALNNAITAASTGDYAAVYLPAGTYKVSSDLTVPANVMLVFASRAKLSVDSGKTVTINGPILVGYTQIFSGAGTVTGPFGGVKEVVPQWWGAVADGVTDDSPAIKLMQAYAATLNNCHTVFFPPGLYYIDSTVTWDTTVHIKCVISELFSTTNARGGTVFVAGSSIAADEYVFDFYNSSGQMQGVSIEGASFLGCTSWIDPDIEYGAGTVYPIVTDGRAVCSAMRFKNLMRKSQIRDVKVVGFQRHGVEMDDFYDAVVDNLTLTYCGTDNTYAALKLAGATNITNAVRFNALHIEHCQFMLDIYEGRHISFLATKFEIGSDTYGDYRSIVVRAGSSEIYFGGGTMFVNHLATNFGTAGYPATLPYFIALSSSKTVFDGCFFTLDGAGSKWIQDLGSGNRFVNCRFENCYAGDYSIVLGNNSKFLNNYVYVTGAGNKRYGIKMGSENEIKHTHIDGTTATVTEGDIFHCTGTGNQIEARITGTYYNRLGASGSGNNIYDFFSKPYQTVETATDKDTTPSVLGIKYLKTENTGATAITDFDNPHIGQVLVVLFNDDNTTIVHNGTDIILKNDKSWTPKTNDSLTLLFTGALWEEIDRRENDGVVTFASTDATPSVIKGASFLTANAAPTTITTFDNGHAGQRITVQAGDANTTLANGATLVLDAGANFVMGLNDSITLEYINSVWYERGRLVMAP